MGSMQLHAMLRDDIAFDSSLRVMSAIFSRIQSAVNNKILLKVVFMRLEVMGSLQRFLGSWLSKAATKGGYQRWLHLEVVSHTVASHLTENWK